MFKLFDIRQVNNHIQITIIGIKMSFYHEEKELPILPYIETHIVDHCNLNCNGCSHYCPVTRKNNKNIKKFEKDLKNLSNKFRLKKLFLMGGEPLLHPQINKFVVVARKYFPETEICILTNGTLLKKKDAAFWDTLRQNKIKLGLTKYPATENYFDELENLVKENQIEIGAIHEGKRFAYRLSKNAKIEDFKYCPTKICNNLRNGKLYICPIGCYMDNFNKYFKSNYPREKGISIRFNSSRKILEYLKTPPCTCSICLGKEEDWSWKDWSASTRKENEWFVD